MDRKQEFKVKEDVRRHEQLELEVKNEWHTKEKERMRKRQRSPSRRA